MTYLFSPSVNPVQRVAAKFSLADLVGRANAAPTLSTKASFFDLVLAAKRTSTAQAAPPGGASTTSVALACAKQGVTSPADMEQGQAQGE